MAGSGLDCGTYTLVCAKRNAQGDFECTREVNAFLEIKLDNEFVFNMMDQFKVPLIRRDDVNVAYIIGEAAINMAYTMTTLELRRPMKDGCINPKEHDAFEILKDMLHGMIGEVSRDKEIVCFSIPANAVNEETDAEHHRKVLEAILRSYRSEKGYSIDPRPVNEAMALVYAELKDTMFTGLGCSFGAGMVNVAFGLYGVPVFAFSLVNSGDWIDHQAARACGETVAFINKEKTKIDLRKEPQTLVERAIKIQYELMIEKTVTGIKQGMESNRDKNAKLDRPLDIVVAGGTASPPGFVELFESLLRKAKLPVELGAVIRPPDTVTAVARGLLVAAENSR